MAGSKIFIPCPGIEPGQHERAPGILVTRPARDTGQKLISSGSLPPVNNAFIMEAEAVNSGTKYIIRDIAQQQVGEHIEKQFIQLRQRQGRDAQPQRKGVCVPHQ